MGIAVDNPLILAADDEETNLQLYCEILQPLYQLRTCTSGDQALQLATLDPLPDLILLDVMMPGMTGHSVLQQLREDRRTRSIPVVFVTGQTDERDEESAFRLGAVDYITKPVKPAIMRARIAAHLNAKFASDWLHSRQALLVREFNHRVMNNLNVMLSLMNLQTSYIRTPEHALNAFHNSRDRLQAMALVYKELFAVQDSSRVSMQKLIGRIIRGVFAREDGGAKIQTQIDCQDLALAASHAIPCGLMLNELITNAVKHGFPNGDRGRVLISFGVVAGPPNDDIPCGSQYPFSTGQSRPCYELRVTHNGVGLTDDHQVGDGMGLTLVKLMTEQLRGAFLLQSDGGVNCVIRFPAAG